MCNYSQMILENGLLQGRLEAYIKMYLSSILTLDRAAKECNISKEEFNTLVDKYKENGTL